MFNNLQDRLSESFRKLIGKAHITEKNIELITREVKKAFLEADVGLSITKDFIHQVRKRALGMKVQPPLQPYQAFIKLVQEELTQMMGEKNETLQLNCQPPAVILMAGLQGSGKTTTVGKLAAFLKDKKSVLVTSVDVYRPSAIEQLKILAEQVQVDYFPSETDQDPVTIATNAITMAKKTNKSVVIIDTAGRTAIDETMMEEIKRLHQAVNPIETLFVVDSMTGQDAVNTAKAFNETIDITGVILTKCDGDARGGAALSLRAITGKPIKFIGVGEKIADLSPFYPDRIASQILGMGDLLGLVEDLESKFTLKEKDKAQKMVTKAIKGQFNLEDFRLQLQQTRKMGGIAKLLTKIPIGREMEEKVKSKVRDDVLRQKEGIINSMTMQERYFPHIIKGSRLKRIAQGSGMKINDVNNLIKEVEKLRKGFKKLGKLEHLNADNFKL